MRIPLLQQRQVIQKKSSSDGKTPTTECFFKTVLLLSNLSFIEKKLIKRLYSKHGLNIFVLPRIPKILMFKISKNYNGKVLGETMNWKRIIYNWILVRWAYHIFELTGAGVYRCSLKFLSCTSREIIKGRTIFAKLQLDLKMNSTMSSLEFSCMFRTVVFQVCCKLLLLICVMI